jgi:AbrB family looped-hinge helix DNA binding protein
LYYWRISVGEQVKVLQKGKITIPVSMRQKLGIEEGDCVTLEIIDNHVVILPPNTIPNPTEALIGLAEGVGVKEPIKKDLKKAAAARVERKLSRAK